MVNLILTTLLIAGLYAQLRAQRLEITYEESDFLPEIAFEPLRQVQGLERALQIRRNAENIKIVYTLFLSKDSSSYVMRHRRHLEGGDTLNGRRIFPNRAITRDTEYKNYKTDASGIYFANDLPDFKWTIYPDSVKEMLGYRVILAESSHEKWKAWFAPSLAAAYGPRGLVGLPGAVLYAERVEGSPSQIRAVRVAQTKSWVRHYWPVTKYKNTESTPAEYANKHFHNFAF